MMQLDEIGRRVEPYFVAFDAVSMLHLPLAARLMVCEWISDLSFDRAGLIDRTCELDRHAAHRFAISQVRLFLREFAREIRDHKKQTFACKTLTIDVFTIRLSDWLAKCPCWPIPDKKGPGK
jgi:hypothetical protein